MEDALNTRTAPSGVRPVFRRIADLPGPRAWPLVGNLLQLKTTCIHEDVKRRCRNHWRYVQLPGDRRLVRSNAALRSAIDALIAAASARMAHEQARRERPGNLLEATISAADQRGSGVNDQAVAGNVSTMLLAGEYTTANTLAWMLYLLHRHPEAMRCAQEAMRLKPVTPFMPLEALRHTRVADVRLPKDSLVWCVLRHDSVDDAYFPNTTKFVPQRWLERDESSTEKSAGTVSAIKGVGVPFDAGLRTCPGRHRTMLEMKIAMTMLLGRFEVEAVDTQDGKEAAELMGFVMSPLGLRLRLRLRG